MTQISVFQPIWTNFALGISGRISRRPYSSSNVGSITTRFFIGIVIISTVLMPSIEQQVKHQFLSNVVSSPVVSIILSPRPESPDGLSQILDDVESCQKISMGIVLDVSFNMKQ